MYTGKKMDLLKNHIIFLENIEQTTTNSFLSKTNDPQIWFGFKKSLSYGWYKFEIKANFKSVSFDNIHAKIYFDFNGGFTEDDSYEFNLRNGAFITFYIKLNQSCNRIRLDPHENSAGNIDFYFDQFKVTRQNKYTVFLDQFLKNKKKFTEYFTAGVKSIGNNLYNIKKNIKANAIEFTELPRIAIFGKETGTGEKIFHDITFFLKNRSKFFKEKREFSVFNSSLKPIAFYLPQYHPIKENDYHWCEGFTEWTNITKAFSQFEGHYQPHLPADLGFYNLTDINAIRQQIDMAKKYGIYGFCIYHYWFEGKRVLEKPLDIFLKNKYLDINFMLCWANENWTKRWDGLDNQVLLKQNHTKETDKNYLDSIVEYLRDPRYITVNGMPVLMVYKPALFPDFKQTAGQWRKRAKEKGFKGLYLVSVKGFECEDPRTYGLDAVVEFPPATPAGHIELNATDKKKVNICNPDFVGKVYDYRKVADYLKRASYNDYTVYKGVMPSWDNTPRRNNDGHVFHFSSPDVYKDWLYEAAEYTRAKFKEDNQFVFINAWNEWAEGTHLEPDRYFGYSLLDSTAQVLEYFPKKLARNDKIFNDIGFCIHIHYPEIWCEIDAYLQALPSQFNLFISISENAAESKKLKDKILSQYSGSQVKIVKNKGRDILPFLLFTNEIISSGCKYLCKIHTKKSFHRTDGHVWRKELFEKLLGSKKIIELIHNYFSNYMNIGIIGPEGHLLNTKNYWGENKPLVSKLIKKMNYEINDEYHFIAGSMFWIRVEVLKELLKLDLREDDFESEHDLMGIKDGTLSHAIERIFSICCLKKDMTIIDTRIFHGHLSVPFNEIKRYDPNNYEFAVPIPNSYIS
jgi:lipopolysaccharide biosynthesis protein